MRNISSILNSLYLILVALLVMLGRGLPLWLFTFLVVLFLAAPLLREAFKALDERQQYIAHLSSHVAFYVMLALLIWVMGKDFLQQHRNPPPVWYLLLLAPLVVKFLFSLFINYGFQVAAQKVGYFFATVWLLFVILGHGLSLAALIEALPFLLIVLISWMANRYPLLSGIGFILLAIGLTIFFHGWTKLDLEIRLLMYVLIPLPLLVGGSGIIIEKIKGAQK